MVYTIIRFVGPFLELTEQRSSIGYREGWWVKLEMPNLNEFQNLILFLDVYKF